MQVTTASPRIALLRRSLARDATEASSAASESSWSMVDHNDDDALKPAASPANERLSSHISADALSELDIDENFLCDACDEMVRLTPAKHSILHPYTVPRVSLAHTLQSNADNRRTPLSRGREALQLHDPPQRDLRQLVLLPRLLARRRRLLVPRAHRPHVRGVLRRRLLSEQQRKEARPAELQQK